MRTKPSMSPCSPPAYCSTPGGCMTDRILPKRSGSVHERCRCRCGLHCAAGLRSRRSGLAALGAGDVAFRVCIEPAFAVLRTEVKRIALVLALCGRSLLVHLHIAHVISCHRRMRLSHTP